jgi:hypothetical protein
MPNNPIVLAGDALANATVKAGDALANATVKAGDALANGTIKGIEDFIRDLVSSKPKE